MFSTLRKLETMRINNAKRRMDFSANLGTLAARWTIAGQKAQQFRDAYEPVLLEGKGRELALFEENLDKYSADLLARARKDLLGAA